MRNCILVELTDGSIRAFVYPDEESAARWYEECRTEWNEERNLIFYRRSSRFGPSHEMYEGDNVAHLELTTPEIAAERGAESRAAVTFG